MWVTLIPIVICALGTVRKGLLKHLKIGERAETIQTTALLRSAWIRRRIFETRGDLLFLGTVKDHHLTLVLKTCKELNKNNNQSQPDLMLINKKNTCNQVGFAISVRLQNKNQRKRKRKWIPGSCQGKPIQTATLGIIHKGRGIKLEEVKIRSRDNPEKISQNTEYSFRNLKRQAITQPPVNAGVQNSWGVIE